MRYVVRLVQEKFRIDLVGKCFFNSIKEPSQAEMLQYRFYFSFIDSQNCSDYFTDQIWFPLRLGIVPVVFGPKLDDVTNLLPHNSFIHVSSSQSPKGLIKFLRWLEKNEKEYKKFFVWRIKKDIDSDDIAVYKRYPNINLIRHFETSGWTQLCEKYHGVNKSISSSITSIQNFALDTENKECIK